MITVAILHISFVTVTDDRDTHPTPGLSSYTGHAHPVYSTRSWASHDPRSRAAQLACAHKNMTASFTASRTCKSFCITVSASERKTNACSEPSLLVQEHVHFAVSRNGNRLRKNYYIGPGFNK